MSEDHTYFEVLTTACTIKTPGALAIYSGDRPRKNADGGTTFSMRAPLLLMPPEMFEDAEEVMRKVARVLNEHAGEFFDSAKASVTEPEPRDAMLCPERRNTPQYPGLPAHDEWNTRPNGDRTCSFCGSLHPDDYMRLIKLAADSASGVWVERASGKTYKWYVRQPEVANASQGGIKFYAWHIPSEAWAIEANAICTKDPAHDR